MKLLIVGAGGFGREMHAWARQHPDHGRVWTFGAFLDDNPIEGIGINHTEIPVRPAHYARVVGQIAHITRDNRIRPVTLAQSLSQFSTNLSKCASNQNSGTWRIGHAVSEVRRYLDLRGRFTYLIDTTWKSQPS